MQSKAIRPATGRVFLWLRSVHTSCHISAVRAHNKIVNVLFFVVPVVHEFISAVVTCYVCFLIHLCGLAFLFALPSVSDAPQYSGGYVGAASSLPAAFAPFIEYRGAHR